MRRAVYLLGDIVANCAAGAAVGSLAALLIGPEWPHWLAMVAGMLGGMALALGLAIGFGIILGAFEVMLPMMLTGMITGMAGAMLAGEQAGSVAVAGALLGLATLGFCYVMDGLLGGEAFNG